MKAGFANFMLWLKFRTCWHLCLVRREKDGDRVTSLRAMVPGGENTNELLLCC